MFAKLKKLYKAENGKNHFLALIITVATIGLVVVFSCAIVMFISASCNEIYSMPRNNGGEADFTGFSFSGRTTCIDLGGEWEFFYNKWIETEEMHESAPDCKVYIPGKWTGAVVDNKKITGSGYASYRMTLKNVPANIPVKVFVSQNPIPYRAYVNGNLSVTNGVMSKSLNTGRTDGKNQCTFIYVTDDIEDITIVIEVSNTSLGGLTDSPKMDLPANTSVAKYDIVNNIPLLILGALFTLMVIHLVISLALYGEKRDLSSFAFIAALFFHYIFSKEMFQFFANLIINVPSVIFYLGNFITILFALLALIFHIQKLGIIKLKKPMFYVLLSTLCISFLLYYLFHGNSFQFIPMFFIIFLSGFVLYRILYDFMSCGKDSRSISMVYGIILTTLLFITAMQGIDFFGWTVLSVQGVPSFTLLGLMMIQSAIYFFKLRQNTRLALQAVQFEKEYNEMKHASMREQIRPHFIFNSLTSIQNQYHTEISKGDAALTMFSRHLRLNADAVMKDLITFEDELKNINNYFDLENLRFGNRLTLLLDIEYTEFLVPILGLQPLIENAVKYAGTDNGSDGFIMISTARREDKVILTVKDNGKGFNSADIKGNSQGLKNVTARFAYYLNAEMRINSKPDEGTEIQIVIPLEKEDSE